MKGLAEKYFGKRKTVSAINGCLPEDLVICSIKVEMTTQRIILLINKKNKYEECDILNFQVSYPNKIILASTIIKEPMT